MSVDKKLHTAPTVTAKIRAHYVDNARDLPWRSPLGTPPPDPYHVWLSEIMLQQTTVAAVIPYFERFTQRWRNVAALASADLADVLAAWAGLGYYARARNLHKCANAVTHHHGGIFPRAESELRKLPGIGDYTAAAIAAIAYGERAIVIDANIERIVARLFAISTPLPRGKSEILAAMDAITPTDGAGDFAQACMDLGATICTARNPTCQHCPLADDCKAYACGTPTMFPVKAAKKPKPLRKGRCYWIERNGQILLRERPPKGMLAGMRALPDDNWSARADGNQRQPIAGEWEILHSAVQHSFTHFDLVMDIAIYRSQIAARQSLDGVWWPIDNLASAGLPTVFAKAARIMIEERICSIK